MNNENYYNILGVDENISNEELKKVYRKLAKEKHPDAGGNEEEFKKISEAYDVLGNEEKRSEYDRKRSNPFNGFGGMGDIFSNMFHQSRQRRNTPITKLDLNIGVLESFRGEKKQVSYKRQKKCDPCQGTGGKKETCQTCKGEGITWKEFGSGMFVQMVQTACGVCGGNGFKMIEPCFVCNGAGTRGEIKQVEIKLPHGVDNGQFVKLSGMGDFYDGVYGDLIVRINLNAQDNFDKYENHLVYNVYMDLEQLKSGSILIPHPDGEINVKLPKKIDTSLPLRVKSKGFKFSTVGDLIINQYVKFDRD